jgi:hypothetical protein
LFAPDRHVPWKPLDLADQPGLATHGKLRALSRQPAACRSLLSNAGVRFTEIPPRTEGDFCALKDVVRIDGGLGPYLPSPNPIMTCPMAAAMTIWERQVIKPAAARAYGKSTIAIQHMGTYACRRQYGRDEGPVSQHAFANAFDIAGFRVTAGRRLTMLKDWDGQAKDARFLREVQRGAWQIFSVTLSPDYNAAHADHLHVDMGPARAVR